MAVRAGSIARATALAGLSLLGTPALAEYEVYTDSEGTTKFLFNVNAIGAGYSSTDPWFGESESFLGANTNDWADFGIEPSLSLEMPLGQGLLFGQVSGVYTSTYGEDASGLTVGIDDQQELTLEQGHVGWRAEDIFAGLEGDTLSITFGRQDYNIGTGLLINDGGGDGGELGGWYLGMRKAFSEALVASLDSDSWLIEAFRLKNRPRGGGTQGEVYGGNVEYTFGDAVTLGGTYMNVDSNLPGSDQLDVFSARLDWALTNGLGFSGEYADESSSQIGATGYYGQVSYALQDTSWSPVFSYRYAHFDGDDPTTLEDERFREIAYGFTDYGSWYQGEITGGYALGNGNVISHMLRAKAQPRENLTVSILYYDFALDQPTSFGTGVTSDDWGDELNFTVDWEASEHLYVVGVVGMLFPGQAAEQWTGGNEDWLHAMLYLSYSW